MGTITNSQINCCTKRYINNQDLNIDKNFKNPSNIKKIILIQSIFRGLSYRKKKNNDGIKTIPLDYNTDSYELNPHIQKIDNLLPKFKLTEKETYFITHCKFQKKALLYPNKSIYKGTINNLGLREGFGELYSADGSIYKGFFHNNKMEGRGRLLSISGYIYEGNFKNDLSNGFGKYISLNGTSYTGNWKDDKQSGQGDITYSDGSRYKGNFLFGKKNGFGKIVFNEQNIYEGNFINNKIEGEGVYHWKDGRAYSGNWENNKMNGYGIFKWPDKRKYYGHYNNNIKEGFGIFYWEDGHSYEGFWKDGKQHGYGIIKNETTTKYGLWDFGKFSHEIEQKIEQQKIDELFDKEKKTKKFANFKANIENHEKRMKLDSSSIETKEY